MKKTAKKKRSNTLAEFCRALKKYDRFLLSCHVTPEGDAIGSILAMESLLRRMGKKTAIVAEDTFPERLFCLPSKRWIPVNEFKKDPHDFQALIVADCPNLERTGKVKKLVHKDMVVFNIDHHISNECFGDYNYVLPKAVASGEVVYEIFKHMRMPLTKEEAAFIYIALSTDTGSFKYENTTVNSHLMAAEFIKKGINIEQINEDLYATYSLNKIQLYSRLLGRVKTEAGGKIAWVLMKRDDLEHSGATYEDTEGFIDFLKYLREVKIAFFASEIAEPGKVRVSFRSKDNYDANGIATHFNGGGHKKASGCIIHGTGEEAVEKILHRLRREFHIS